MFDFLAFDLAGKAGSNSDGGGERTGMDILQDLQDYNREFSVWLDILKAMQSFNSGVSTASNDDNEALATRVLGLVGELSDAGTDKKSNGPSAAKAVKIPQKLLGEVFSIHARAAYREDDGEHSMWVQRVANQHFLSGIMENSTLQDMQMKMIRDRLVDLFRASGKLLEVTSILKALSLQVANCGDATFQNELQKLCMLASIREVDDTTVEDIVRAKEKLIAPGAEGREPSSWQKALVFLPSGTQLVAFVDEEVKQLAKIDGLEMDLKVVEDSVSKWSGDSMDKTLLNTEINASLPVTYSQEVVTLVSDSRALLSSLLAKATSRFKKTRDERLRSVERSLVSMHDALKSAMSTKLKAAISMHLTTSAADLNSNGDDGNGNTWSHLPQLDKMVWMMHTVPLEEAKIDKIMDEQSLEALKMWWKQCKADVVTISSVMKAVPRDGKGINLEEPALAAFLAWDVLPASFGIDGDAAEWTAFRIAMLQQVQRSVGRKLTAKFPRELTPTAASALQANTLAMWEDMLDKAGPVVTSVTQESIATLRAMVDAVLNIRTYLSKDWAVQVEKKGGTAAKPAITTITMSVDAVMTSIVLVAYRMELRAFLELAVGLNTWEKKFESEERVQVMKDFLKVTELFGCIRQTAMPAVQEFASKFDGDSPTALARNINSFCSEVCKAHTDKAFAVVVKHYNLVIRMAKKLIGQCLGEFSKDGNGNMVEKLDKMSEEGKMIDSDSLKGFVAIGAEDFAKKCYQQFRFWNEAISESKAFMMKEQVVDQSFVVEAWGEDDVVKRAGKVAGSMTLMQGLTSQPPEGRAGVLLKTVKGLAILGKGLMEGHSAVMARVNHCLAEAAAAESQASSDPAAAEGPPGKKPKTAARAKASK